MLRFWSIIVFVFLLGTPMAAEAQGWDPRTEAAERTERVQRADAAIAKFLEIDPTLKVFFDEAYGYAVFPKVSKGAVGIGGARGKGILYEGGEPAHRAYLTQYTLGFQLGGKTYAELVFFRDVDAYNRFLDGEFAFSAQATAIILSDGTGATADYSDDVAVFTRERSGAMFEASVGGQTFTTRELR